MNSSTVANISFFVTAFPRSISNVVFCRAKSLSELIDAQKSTATLSKAYQDIVAEFLRKARAQAEFDKDIFARLVDTIRIKSRDDITFILKDGTEVKADTADDIAA